MANLKTKICGIDFPNPIWTAAGPTSANSDLLLKAAKGGAGGLVAKTISVKPARVPIPNISSPFPGSLLNAELWSEIDYKYFIDHVYPETRKSGIPLIASVGYSPEDLRLLGEMLDRAKVVDAIEFSIHYVGKDAQNLANTARALKETTSLPILAKLSPAILNITEAIEALDPLVDGYVAINSLGPALDFNIETRQPVLGSNNGRGWLSGRAILPVGLHYVATIASHTDKPVIGVGGIRHVTDVIKYIMAGASAVQICSMAILKGDKIYTGLAEKLSAWMDEHDYQTIDDLRGAYLSRDRGILYYLGDGPQLYPEIIEDKCTHCDLCVKSCMYNAIQFVDKKYIFNQSKCVSCGLCTSVCAPGALLMKEFE